MNIFMLDSHAGKAAMAHCDKHVVKMILESAQLLCTALNESGVPMPYRSTHINHPCAKWVRESRTNAIWLLDLASALNDEYRYRYSKRVSHKSYVMLEDMGVRDKLSCLPDKGWTSPALAMPDKYWVLDDAVTSYRRYYKGEKQAMLTYTKRNIPEWL